MEAQAKILIVDDDDSFLDLMVTIISGMGYKTLTANDGKEALTILKETADIALILTDFEMPGMNGPTLVKKVHKNKALNHIPMIMVSGRVGFKEAGYLLGKGVRAFREKPIFPAEIIGLVKLFIEGEGPAGIPEPPEEPEVMEED